MSVAEGMDYDNKIQLQNHPSCMLCGYETGSLKYFSVASWRNIKLYEQMALEGHCRTKEFFFLGTVHLQQVLPCFRNIEHLLQWLAPALVVVSSCQQFLTPTSVEFSRRPSSKIPLNEVFPNTLEGEFPARSTGKSPQLLLAPFSEPQPGPNKVCISVLGGGGKLHFSWILLVFVSPILFISQSLITLILFNS